MAVILAAPASAHSLKVFARVQGSQVSGYAFFVGGGRPAGADWFATSGDKRLAEGKTGPDGSYAFQLPAEITHGLEITVDTREGHIASTTIGVERLARQRAGHNAVLPSSDGGALSANQHAGNQSSVGTASAQPPLAETVPHDAATTQHIEDAIERQLGPVLERLEIMDARMRLSDFMAGVFFIIGLAGIGLWARQRKR